MEDAAGEQPGGPRRGSDFQNLHRNKRAMTLNLKDPKGVEVFRRPVGEGRCGGRKFSAPTSRPSSVSITRAYGRSIRASSMAASPASGRTAPITSARASIRSIAQSMGGADVDHRRARPGTDAGVGIGGLSIATGASHLHLMNQALNPLHHQ